jgi:hypothetical protein
MVHVSAAFSRMRELSDLQENAGIREKVNMLTS